MQPSVGMFRDSAPDSGCKKVVSSEMPIVRKLRRQKGKLTGAV